MKSIEKSNIFSYFLSEWYFLMLKLFNMSSKKGYSSTKLVFIFVFSICIFEACSPKVGCPAAENATIKADKKGELPTKGGSSQLFSSKGGVSMKKAKKQRQKQIQKIYGNRRT